MMRALEIGKLRVHVVVDAEGEEQAPASVVVRVMTYPGSDVSFLHAQDVDKVRAAVFSSAESLGIGP